MLILDLIALSLFRTQFPSSALFYWQPLRQNANEWNLGAAEFTGSP